MTTPATDIRADEPSAEPISVPNRKHPAHGVLSSTAPTIVFLTVCTKNRAPWLADPGVHATLIRVWADARAWLVGRYVLMPDHLHLFAAPGELDVPLDNWVRYWKSQFTKRHRIREHVWQTDHWDRRIRREEGYDAVWEYVVNNPVRKNLVTNAVDWLFQGTLFELRWD